MVRNIGIARKAQITAFLMIMTTAIVTGVTFYQGASDTLIKEKMQSAEQETRLEAVRIEVELSELRRDAQFLANAEPVRAVLRAQAAAGSAPAGRTQREALETRLAGLLIDFVQTKPAYLQIRLMKIAEAGRDIINIKRIDASTARVAAPADTAEALQQFTSKAQGVSASVYLSEVLPGSADGAVGPHIMAMAPVVGEAQQVEGLLIVSMDLGTEFLAFSNGHANELHHHLIIDNQGYYLEHFDDTKEFNKKSRLQDDFPQLSHALRPDFLDDALVMTDYYQGQPAIYTVRKISIDNMRPDHFIGFVEIIRFDAVLTALKDLRRTSSIMVVLIIVIGGLAAMTIARRMVSPLVAITQGMQAFAAGREVGGLPTNHTDEMGVLAREFKHMVEELKIREYDLRVSNERFQQIVEHLNEVFWVAGPDYRLSYVSPAYEFVCGAKCQTAYESGNILLSAIHPEDVVRVSNYLEDVSRLPSEGLELDYRIIIGETTRWLRNRIFPVHKNGRLVNIVGVAENITERKEAEEALHKSYAELIDANAKLEETQNQLLQSEKMASIGQLAAGVAHEINNPIGYVNSNIGSLKKYVAELLTLIKEYEELERRLPPNDALLAKLTSLKLNMDLDYVKDDLRDLLRESEEGLARVKKIVQDLKEFSHIGADEWAATDIHKGLDSTLNIVHNEIKYKAEVIKDYGVVPQIECIPSQLNQVFMNLLVNAAQAIQERGSITIRTGVLQDMAYIAVRDTGSGIEEKHLPKLFDPFFTTQPVGKGTGLGLSLSYSIVNKHGGHIDVESTLGEGTTFTVWLPLKQPDAATNAGTPQEFAI
ncbi:MAG: ATP-binding protein [Pseudomonadota bacterium]